MQLHTRLRLVANTYILMLSHTSIYANGWVPLYQITETRKLRAYAQMDKQKAIKELEERMKKEHACDIAELRSLLGLGGKPLTQRDGAPKQVGVFC